MAEIHQISPFVRVFKGVFWIDTAQSARMVEARVLERAGAEYPLSRHVLSEWLSFARASGSITPVPAHAAVRD